MTDYELRAKVNSLHPQAGFDHNMRFNTAVGTLRHQAKQTCFKIEYLFAILFKMNFGEVTTPSPFTNFPILLYLMTVNIRNFSRVQTEGTVLRNLCASPFSFFTGIRGTCGRDWGALPTLKHSTEREAGAVILCYVKLS